MADPLELASHGPPAGPGGLPPGVRVAPIPRELLSAAAARLIGELGGPRGRSAHRMLSAAALHGIDLSLMWGTVGGEGMEEAGGGTGVRQVCLAVPGSGKTAMLMVSPPAEGRSDDGPEAAAERIACILEACGHLAAMAGQTRPIHLAQALPDPSQVWALRAFEGAGFTKVGELAYMRLHLATQGVGEDHGPWPPGVTVRNILWADARDRALLMEALEASYEQTLDCPELCGLRSTEDVVESHRATGVFDENLWWLVLHEGRAHGCMLLNRCPDLHAVELVYLGLSPRLRGMRLGSRLLALGLGALEEGGPRQVTCAVDLRNAPAIRLYRRAGFGDFALRVAFVKVV